ncbi:MAG: preprotein translocase subunit YajC, partial [Methyloceanibacter sp.]
FDTPSLTAQGGQRLPSTSTSIGTFPQVVTGGGLIGRIVELDGTDILEIELADSMRVRALRSSIEAKFRRAHDADFKGRAVLHNS